MNSFSPCLISRFSNVLLWVSSSSGLSLVGGEFPKPPRTSEPTKEGEVLAINSSPRERTFSKTSSSFHAQPKHTPIPSTRSPDSNTTFINTSIITTITTTTTTPQSPWDPSFSPTSRLAGTSIKPSCPKKTVS